MYWPARVLRDPVVARALQGLVPPGPGRIRIGRTPEGQEVILPSVVLARHWLVQGSSGYGKSRLICAIVVQLILQRVGGVLCDPIGTLALLVKQLLASFCFCVMALQQKSTGRVRQYLESLMRYVVGHVVIVEFTPTKKDSGWRVNPLEPLPGMSVSQTADAFLRVLERLIGSLSEMRRLQLILKASLCLVIEAGGCLRDVLDVLSVTASTRDIGELIGELDRRNRRVGKRPDLVRKFMTDMYLRYDARSRIERTESAWNALNLVLGDETFATLVDCTKSTLDFHDLVHEEKFLVLRISKALGLNAQISIASMFIDRLSLVCELREGGDAAEKSTPYYTILDEFHLVLGKDRAMADAITTSRNYSQYWGVAFQSSRQGDLGSEEGRNLLATWRGNSATHVYFRCPIPDAQEFISDHVFRPRGLEEKLRYIDESQSVGVSESETLSRQISLSIAHAQSRGTSTSFTSTDGQSYTLTESDGLTVVEGNSFSVAQSSNWSCSVSDGVTVTCSASETYVNGEALGKSNSESRGESVGESYSRGEGVSGEHLALGDEGHAMSLLGAGRAMRSRNYSDSRSSSRTASEAMSKVISAARSLAHGCSESRSRQVSKTEGGGRTVSTGKTFSEAKSHMESIARGLSRSVSKGRSESQGETHTQTRGASLGISHQRARSETKTRREVIERYSVSEERDVGAYEIGSLARQEAWVVTDDPAGGREVYRLRVIDVPDVRWKAGPWDGMAKLMELCGPPAATPAPNSSLFLRMKVGRSAKVEGEDV